MMYSTFHNAVIEIADEKDKFVVHDSERQLPGRLIGRIVRGLLKLS